MNILLILLGCNISYLLNNRIDAAIHFVAKFNDTNVDWFLSGGIKHPHEDTVTEAEKMSHQIVKFEHQFTGNKWNYVYDTVATNTAENFIMANHFINKMNKQYDAVYIVTSKFHQKRANKIAEAILDIDYQWILSGAKCEDSEYWERIHIRNVNDDLKKAFNKFINTS